jgi:AcrR family transcriptional regulator
MKGPAARAGGRRQRRRDRTRAALMDAALRLFSERGYDATTIEDITERADVAPRTFFSYFSSKEEVLFGEHPERREALIDELRRRLEHEPIWPAVSAAMLTVIEAFEEDPEFFLSRARLYTRWPALRSAVLRINDALIESVAAVLVERLGTSETTRLQARLIAAMANAATRCAIDEWVASSGEADLRRLAEEALEFVRPARMPPGALRARR